MASPFSLFRKNQKLLLASLTLLAMFAFVFLDPLMKYMAPNAAMADPVIVETNFGDLKRSDIAKLQAQRAMVESFLTTLAYTTVDKLQDQGLVDLRSPGMLEYAAQRQAEMYKQRVMRGPNPTDERETIYTQLLARRAKEKHMVVSDAAINALLQELTMNSVDPRTLGEIVHRLRIGGGHAGEQQLFDALRTEMLAEAAARSFAVSLEGTPPAELWDYYRRLNQKATIEAVAVPVADFQDAVKDPGDEVLKKFFEEHKNHIQQPGSPEPGFKLPRRAQFQFFKAEFDLFRELAEVTDEEIAKYYEANKDAMFRKLELPAADTDGDKPDDAGEGADEGTPEQAEKAEPAAEAEIMDDDDAAEGESTTEATPAKEEAAPPGEPADDAVEDNTSIEENPTADENPAADESSAAEGNPGDDKIIGGLPATTEVALEDGPALGQPTAEAATEEEKEPTDSEPADSEPADSEPADSEPADKPEEPADKPASATEEKPAAAPEYEPLEKVRDQIERTLKAQKAEAKIREGIEQLASRVRAYADARAIYLVNQSKQNNAVEPKLPNFVELAKEHKFSFEETPLVSYFELSADKSLGSARYAQMPYANYAFSTTPTFYEPVAAEDVEGNVYLVWKIAQEDEQVPKFEEVRDEVLKKYRLVEARSLARKRAEELAAQARTEKQPLSKVAADTKFKLVTPPPFTWMTLGSTADNATGRMPLLNDVAGIDRPGEAFMRTTFGLDRGEIGVAFNQPEDVCYAVQLIDYAPPVDVLEGDFAREDFRRYLNVAVGEKRQLLRSWLDQVEKDAGVKWLQAPSADDN